jgi:hypothetical protein
MSQTLRSVAVYAGLAALAVFLYITVGAQKPPQTKAQLADLGRQHKTAAELFQALKNDAKGGHRLEWSKMPDWSGVYTRKPAAGFAFDPDTPPGALPTAKLTPEYQAKMMKRIEDLKKGIEWDPISTCAPPGVPRWLTEPFLREFVVTPDQTWLINEMVNDIRRVYTDGLWDGDRLVVHTNQLKAGIYQRAHPDYTDQVETVEIWRKEDDKTLGADVWVYDPPALVEPWFTHQTYLKLSDPDKSLRIRYWNCGENENNAVQETKEGATEFKGFTFVGGDQKQGGK